MIRRAPRNERPTHQTGMNHEQIERLAKRLMDQHGISSEYTFRWNRRKSSLGVCRNYLHGGGEIQLSRYIITSPTWQILDTILHEIAHAIACIRHGFNVGHDDRWKAICREIGAEPIRLADDEHFRPPHKYKAICVKCGYEHGFDRDPGRFITRGYTHADCGGDMRLPQQLADHIEA